MDVDEVEKLFVDSFGGEEDSRKKFLEETVCVMAPGRVNLIGEHTDYCEGFVMPFGLHYKTTIVAKKNNLGHCRVVSAQQQNVVETFTVDDNLKPGEKKWFKYVQGVIAQYMKDINEPISFDAAFSSDVPLGGGLSSSASLEVATATMLETLYGVDSVSPAAKALRCVEAEHTFANVPCGIMDQFASSLSKAGHALLIDCRTQEPTYVPLDDPDIAVVVTNSNAPHELTGGEYKERVDQCKEALEMIQKHNPDANIKALRDVTLDQLEASKEHLNETTYKRALHVVTENPRVLKALEASKQKNYNIFGKLMLASHCSLRDNFEVSTPELDTLVAIAVNIEGVFGSRMTGGGFGGCTVTLVKKSSVELLKNALELMYKEKTGKECTCFVTSPSQGATVLRGSS